MIDDVEDEWVHGSSWDFIHLRGMTHILRDMQKLIDQSFTYVLLNHSSFHPPP